jgi:hypothetical protein
MYFRGESGYLAGTFGVLVHIAVHFKANHIKNLRLRTNLKTHPKV